MKKHLSRILIAVLLFVVCAAIAFALVAFLPPFWKGTGGRDFRPQAIMMGLLLGCFSVFFRAVLHWPVLDFVISLVCVEILALMSISQFSGSNGMQLLDSFNLNWLAGMNMFLGAPWLVGLLVGSFLSRRKNGILRL